MHDRPKATFFKREQMASQSEGMSHDDTYVQEVKEPLILESVWIKQTQYEEAETLFAQLSLCEQATSPYEQAIPLCKQALSSYEPMTSTCEQTVPPLEQTSLSNSDDCNDSNMAADVTGTSYGDAYLMQETVWFKQQEFEDAETQYYMSLANTDLSLVKAMPGTPSKRLQNQDSSPQVKKPKTQGRSSLEALDGRLQTEVTSLSKIIKTIQRKLEDYERKQQHKVLAIRDMSSQLMAAIEACEARLNEELAQLSSFHSLLDEIEAVSSKINEGLLEQKWGRFRSHEGYCQGMAQHLSKLGSDLNACVDLYSLFQSDALKSDINKIISELGKVSFNKSGPGSDKFSAKRDTILKTIKDLKDSRASPITSRHSDSSVGSDVSLEGDASESSEEFGNEAVVSEHISAKGKPKLQKGREQKKKSAARPGLLRGNRNNSSSTTASGQTAKAAKPASLQARPNNSSQTNSSTPKKRNAQGVQNSAQKKPDLFKFKGASHGLNIPFLNQPGILGPRPNILPVQSASHPATFRFSSFTGVGQNQRPILPNTLRAANHVSSVNQSALSNINFNFANSQPHSASSLDFGNGNLLHNSTLAAMNLHVSRQGNSSSGSSVNSQVRQSKLFQLQKGQEKGAKGFDQKFVAQPLQSGFSFPSQQGAALGHTFMPTSQTGFIRATGHTSMEQQLNEMSQKIQQMQLAANHNFQLQQLMQETERLKQLIAQKQHQHQQQDRFQQQFQLLINAFLQQQQQLQAQGPQSKMARPMQFQNSHRQQQRIIHSRHQQLQQQKKQKQQQNKVQQVKQENHPKDDSLRQGKQEKHPNVDNLQQVKQEHHPQDDNLQKNIKLSVQQSKSSPVPKKKNAVNINSKVTVIGMSSPHTQGDRHKAGVSSIIVLENLNCVVVVDIINSCLKLFEIVQGKHLHHEFITRLELARPFYMSLLNRDTVVVSRDGRLLSLIRVSKKRLEFLQDIRTDSQYFGLAYLEDNVIVCAAFADKKIDVVCIQEDTAQTTPLVIPRVGPELVAVIPDKKSIIYLERTPGISVRLVCVTQQGNELFTLSVKSEPTDVCNIAAYGDMIVCSNKQTNQMKLISQEGNILTALTFPPGTLTQPFAMTFSELGNLYVANDGAWDSEYEHFVTTEIGVYAFT